MFLKHPRLAYALPLLLACSATVAGAQTAGTGSTSRGSGTIAVEPITVGGVAVNMMVGLFLGVEHCRSDAPVVFELDGIPRAPTIDVYTGTNCNDSDRDDTTTERCMFVDTVTTMGVSDNLRITIPASKFFRSGCDTRTRVEPTVWFLAVSTSMMNAEATAFGTEKITVDSEPPAQPTGVTGGSGESTIRVNWRTGETDLETFVVFIDNEPTDGTGTPDGDAGSNSADGTCGSRTLTAGGDAAALPESFRQRRINEATATGIELTPGDIGGERAAIAVATIDRAGNFSPLSEIACVSVIPTESFWDRYKANGGEAEGGCPCRTAGKAQWLNAWPIALALLALQRRTRKRAS